MNDFELTDEDDEELKREYQSLLRTARSEKAAFLADRVLNYNGIKVLKSLSSKNEFAVTS